MLTQKMARFQRVFVISILIMAGFNILARASYNEPVFYRYYYNQLDTVQKEIYDNLIKSQEKFLNGEEIVFAIYAYDVKTKVDLKDYVESVKKVRNAYVYDNPKAYIWFDVYKSSIFSKEGSIYLKLEPKEEFPNNMKEMIENFEETSSEFISALSGTDEQKLRNIHDMLRKNAIYDSTTSLPNTRTAYGTIVEGHSVCSGFAYAYKYLADLAGLEVVYVVGNLYDKSRDEYYLHAWNVAYVNNEYLLVDVTLDLGTSEKQKEKFLLSPIKDGMHYVDDNRFNHNF
ncbi:MAG: hypothetical protein HFJ50_04855 [Clostridia bacterium]|jgi:hypothetical protein|nr:hypothetical protein [Clostridia bacterium]